MRALAVWLSLTLSLYPVVFADETNPPVILRSTTRLVQLNVIVTKGGQPAGGLKKEDFVVTDNGKPQDVTVFSQNSSAPLPTTATPLPENTFTNRLEQKSGTPASITVILLDTLNTKWSDQAYARRQVVKFLQQIQPGDHIGVYTLGSSLKVLHDYTSDSAELLRRLASYKGGAIPDLQGGEPMKGMDGDTLMLDSWLRGAGATGMERDFYTKDRTIGTLKALEFIADHLSRVPGRKSLIWVSGGFPLTIGFDNMAAWHDPTRLQESFGDEIDRTVRLEQRRSRHLPGGCARPDDRTHVRCLQARLVESAAHVHAQGFARIEEPGHHGGTGVAHRRQGLLQYQRHYEGGSHRGGRCARHLHAGLLSGR